jgi:glycosyltransferase involved in cell wall biosynthesis
MPSDHAHSIQSLNTVRALAELRCDVLMSVKRNPEIPVATIAEGLAFYGLTPHPGLDLRWLPFVNRRGIDKPLESLTSRMRARAADGPRLVHYARHFGLARSAVRARRGPVVVELHKLEPAALAAAREADAVVCITEPLRAAVAAELPEEKPSVAIHDAVDLARFAPPTEAGVPRLVYVGQLHDWKGVDVLLRALAQLPHVPALVVGGRRGDDPRRDALQALAGELGVAGRVTFTGFLPQREIPALLRRGDVGVLPTRAANGQDLAASPLKLFEYMASGLPVVASDLPSIRDVVVDGETGLLFHEGDAEALAAVARRALDAELASRLAPAGAPGPRPSWASSSPSWRSAARIVCGRRDASGGDR